MSTNPVSHDGRSNFLLRYWSGEGPLWRIFWLYGVLASAVLAVLYAAAVYSGNVTAQQILLPIVLVYTAWIVVSVWRCAPNVKEEFYTALSRGLTIAWAINVLLGLTALQMGLLGDYVGHAAM